MTLDSVVSPQVLNKYLILVDVKSGRAGGKAKMHKAPTKSRRVGIYANSVHNFYLTSFNFSLVIY